MRRREFITLVAGAAAAWPLRARAQEATGVRRVAFLHPYAENDPEVLARVIAFREGLTALGWTENRNIQIEHRYSSGDLGRIRASVTELVRSAPDLIVGSGTPITAALKQATSTIPIVFNVVNDPVGQGFVASLSRPGGNITGFTLSAGTQTETRSRYSRARALSCLKAGIVSSVRLRIAASPPAWTASISRDA